MEIFTQNKTAKCIGQMKVVFRLGHKLVIALILCPNLSTEGGVTQTFQLVQMTVISPNLSSHSFPGIKLVP
jgi:hypothetical protein